MKQLANKVTARVTVLYSDTIRYTLNHTIRDKSEVHHAHHTGQSAPTRAMGCWCCPRAQRRLLHPEALLTTVLSSMFLLWPVLMPDNLLCHPNVA